MGYIRLDRKLLSWEWKDDPKMVALWIEILLQANFNDSKWHGEEYERGSFPTSIEKLARATGLTSRETRTCLNRLKSTNEVTIKTTNKGTKIIVNKWADYQCSADESDKQNDKQSDKQATSKRQANDNTIRRKEGKKERNTYIKRTRPDIIPTYDETIEQAFDEERFNEIMKGRYENQTV